MRPTEVLTSAKHVTVGKNKAWEVTFTCECGEKVSGLCGLLADAFTVARLQLEEHRCPSEGL